MTTLIKNQDVRTIAGGINVSRAAGNLPQTPFVGTGVNASVESSNWRGPGRSPTWNVPPFGHPVPAGGLLIHKTSDPMYPGAKMFEPIIQKALESPSFG